MIRTPEGRWEKENPEKTAELESSITTMKIAINRAERLATLNDHPGWETAQEILQEKVDSIRRRIKAFYGGDRKTTSTNFLDQRILDLLNQQASDFEFLLQLVDDFTKSVPGFESSLSRFEKELENRKLKSSN